MFPDLIDICAPAHAFAIKDDMGTRQNIHEQFAKRAANVISLYRTNKGKRNWEQLDEKTLKFHLHEDQLASYEEVEDKVASLRNDVKEWKAAHANLEAEKNNFLMKYRTLSTVWERNYVNFKITTINFKSISNALRKMKGFPTMENIYLRLRTDSAH